MNASAAHLETTHTVRRMSITAAVLSGLLWIGDSNLTEAGLNVWTPTGPTEGPISALAIDPADPRIVYAAAGGEGVFKTVDGGESWTAMNAGLSGLHVGAVVIDPLTPSTLYIGTGGGASELFRSTDGGSTWSAIGPFVGAVTVVAIDPSTPTTLYTGVLYRSWLMKTVDGGENWTIAGFFADFVSGLAIDPMTSSTIYVGASRATPSGGLLYKSVDGGQTWSGVTWGLFDPMTGRRYDVGRVVIDPVETSTVYISTTGGAFKSTNGGGTWARIEHAVTDIDPVTSTNVYAGTGFSGVFKSTDGGATWSALNQGLTDLRVHDLAVDPQTPGILYAATNSGVFVIRQEDTPDNGAPLAEAGPDQIVEASGPDGALVTLDGSGSSDPDGDSLAFVWAWSSGSAGGDRPTVRLPLGTTVLTLTVSDPLGATGTDTVEVTVWDSTPPEVALSAPGAGAAVSGTIIVSAEATDAVGVAGVQFLLDGVPLGPEDTSAPREVPWDTRTASDGTHDLAARARDWAGNWAMSQTVTVTVANGPIPTLALARYEENAATLAPDGAWTEAGNEDFGVALSGSRAVYAAAAGATATFSFTGTGVRWLGFPCERCGVAEVLIDGARVATVDTFSSDRPELWQVMYTSPRLDAGNHRLTIEVTGTANAASAGALVAVDAIEALLDGAGVLMPMAAPRRGLPGTARLTP